MNSDFLKNINIPIPPPHIQENVIQENEKVKSEKRTLQEENNKLNEEIKNQLNGESKFLKNFYLEEDLFSGKRPKGGVQNINDGIISLGGEHIGYNRELILENLKYVPYNFYKNKKNLEVKKNDILICKDGAQTGKCCMINFNINKKNDN